MSDTPQPNILLIDDEAIALANLSHVFEREGYKVTACKSGDAGLAALKTTAFDLVLTDLRMPGMDGYEVCELLQGDDLGKGSEEVLSLLVDSTMPSIIAGLYVAIVLSAIMSTIDSLLVVASSAASRDYYQKVRNPKISNEALVKISRRLTLELALVALAIAMAVAFLNEEQGIFWFVIFGWSGIAATFCPTVILSLCWARMTERGARYGMIAGFLSVPFFKWVAPKLGGAEYWTAIDVLAPSFVVSGLVIVLVSLTDSAGAKISEAARDDLERAKR